MAYCRLGSDSDIYLYESAYGGFQMYIRGKISEWFATRQEVLSELALLAKAGKKIPDSVVSLLQEEIEMQLPEPKWDSRAWMGGSFE